MWIKITRTLDLCELHIQFRPVLAFTTSRYLSTVKEETATWALASLLTARVISTGCQAGTKTHMGTTETMGTLFAPKEVDNRMVLLLPQVISLGGINFSPYKKN